MRLQEACALTRALGNVTILHEDIILLRHMESGYFMSKGIMHRLGEIMARHHIRCIIINASLTAIQHRNLERYWRCRVLERTALILHIFAQHARSFEGRLQVQSAELHYQKSRLVRVWTHLERQRGGVSALSGPGERQKESDRRQIDQHIAQLGKRLKKIQQTRHVQRVARQRRRYPIIALVGYTNAGKSTLFRTLTHARVPIKDQLFVTLDPTVRMIRKKRPMEQTMMLVDTVGFISDLPTQLIDAFRATIEDIREADMILHVRDCLAPAHQREDVESILRALGLSSYLDNPHRYCEILNKIDTLPINAQHRLWHEFCHAYGRGDHKPFPLSAHHKKHCAALCDVLQDKLCQRYLAYTARVDYGQSHAIAWLYAHAYNLKRQDVGDHVSLSFRLCLEDKRHFVHRFPTIPLTHHLNERHGPSLLFQGEKAVSD